MRLFYLPLLALIAFEVHSYKILVYNPRFGHSHSNFLGNIADILADAGHNVTSLISILDPNTKDVTEKSKKILVPRSEETEEIMRGLGKTRSSFVTNNNLDFIGTMKIRGATALHFISQCKALIDETELIQNLREENFDVMIVENFDMCGVGLSHLLKPRSLITSGGGNPFGWMYEDFGIPLSLNFNPSSYISHLDVHSMWSRLTNIYANWLIHYYFTPRRGPVEAIFREKFGDDFPSLEEISSHAAYTFINSEPLIDYATPTLSRVISIGGIGAKQPKSLSKEWEEVLSRRSATILLSFGSVARSADLPPAIKQSVATTIGRFPEITFVWKYEELEDAFAKETAAALPNLYFSSWVPQNDLLSDERLVAFITHGGMGSTQETALRGKPGIFVPFFGDQPRNAGMMEHNGLGKVFDKFDLDNPDKFEAAIREVLSNKKYAANARHMSAMLAKKPFGARELLVKTIEFAAEFGPSAALRPQSYDMSAIEYHNLDVIAALMFTAALIAYVLFRFLLWTLSKIGIVATASASKAKSA